MPQEYAQLFHGARAALSSHRGWDPGALRVARLMARRLGSPLLAATVTRLLVDLNRSLTNRAVFSEFSRPLGPAQRAEVIRRFYLPHRNRVAAQVHRLVEAGTVIHLGVHSFTPVFRGVRRPAEIGLLYDPSRAAERALCRRWAGEIQEAVPELRVRMNYPYRGAADGLTTALRRRHGGKRYLGIELELNQQILGRGVSGLAAMLARTLTQTMAR